MVGTKKSLGQHWLKNRVILDDIADLSLLGVEGSAYDSSDDSLICVEIGPGLGFLTSSLLRRFDKVIAVEFDKRLAENLPKSFPGTNLEVISGDILKFDFKTVPTPYVVAGNIPYYITSPIIEKVLTAQNLPERVVLLVQKEVAERIVSDKETMLSLFVKNRAKVFEGPVVRAEEFTPPPKVDSEVIVMEPHAPEIEDEVFELIRIGFRAPRKKLISNLAKNRDELAKIFAEMGLDLNVRPGGLKLEDWKKLYNCLK